MRLINPARPADTEVRIRVGAVVEYEQHGAPQLALVSGEKKGKWLVSNAAGAQLELPPDRLYLFPGEPRDAGSAASRSDVLKRLLQESEQVQAGIDLGELWELIKDERSEITVREMTELMLGENTTVNHIAMRRALLADVIYFKRKKTTYEPRPDEVVEELRVKARIEAEKSRAREELISAMVAKVRDASVVLPKSVRILERYAALGKSFDEAKEAAALADEIIKRANLAIESKGEDRVFRLLVKAQHFNEDANLTLIRLERDVAFSDELIAEAREISAYSRSMISSGIASGDRSASVRVDLRHLHAITIDNESTRDVDDALAVETLENGYRIGIFIADVASLVRPDSPLDKEALSRSTTVYSPDLTIPMFPPELSEGAASLVEGEDRLAFAYLFTTDPEFEVVGQEIVPAVINVKKRLSYIEADDILEHQPPSQPELCETLNRLWDFACARETRRISAGALAFNRKEMNARLLDDGQIVLEDNNEDTPAHRVVSEMMITANESAALFARERRIALIFRGQEPPEVSLAEQGLEIPEGPARDFYRRSFLKRSVVTTVPLTHFGLGLPAYAQVTSPIRRAADLLNQRQLLSSIVDGQALYSREQLDELQLYLERGLDEAFDIQKERNRYFLLKYLKQNGIREIGATILRVDGPKPLAELDLIFSIAPFIPSTDGDQSAIKRRLGTRTTLRIENIDPRRDVFTLKEIS